MKREVKVLFPLGINYFNLGECCYFLATIDRLREEIPNVRITSISNLTKWTKRSLEVGDIWSKNIESMSLSKRGVEEIFPQSLLQLSDELFASIKYALQMVLLILLVIADKKVNRFRFCKNHKILKKFLETDMIICKGGGYLSDMSLLGLPVSPHILLVLFATLFDKPLVMYAQSIGPFKTRLGMYIVRRLLDKALLILLREEISKEVVREIDVRRPDVRVTADEAFLFKPASKDEIEQILRELGLPKRRLLVGITVRDWHFPFSNNPNRERRNYKQAIVELIERMVENYDAHVLLFCNDRKEDMSITHEVYSQSSEKENVKLVNGYAASDLKGIIGQMDIFVGTRMHSNICALDMFVPVVAIAYQPKTNGIMGMLGLSEWVVPIEGISGTALFNTVRKLISRREEIRNKLRTEMPEVRRKAECNAGEVRLLMNRLNRKADAETT